MTPTSSVKKNIDKGGWRWLRRLTKVSNREPKSLCVNAMYANIYIYIFIC